MNKTCIPRIYSLCIWQLERIRACMCLYGTPCVLKSKKLSMTKVLKKIQPPRSETQQVLPWSYYLISLSITYCFFYKHVLQMSSSRDPTVAIIGGGISGLVCAIRLNQLGFSRVTVFDTGTPTQDVISSTSSSTTTIYSKPF